MWCRVALVLSLAFTLCIAFNFSNQEEFDLYSAQIEKDFDDVFTKYLETGIVTDALQEYYRMFRIPDDLKYKEISEYPEYYSIIACLTCRSTVTTFLTYIRVLNKTMEEVESLAVGVCNNLNMYSKRLCENIVHFMAPIGWYIQEENPDLTAYDICAVVYQSENCGVPRAERLQFEIEVAEDGPEIDDHKTASPDSGNYYKIIHLTDIHFDPGYEVGKNAICDEPMCCRRDQGEPREAGEAAGRWGDYRNCDLPWDFIEKSIKTMAKVHSDVDFVYFTGDAVDHSVWGTSKPYNLLLLEKIYDLLKVEFKNAKVLPTIGNHEAHPVNIFAPPDIPVQEFSPSYLYNFLALSWSHWIPLSSLQSLQQSGCYTFLLAPGFRVIAINNNLAYTFNFWILHDTNYLKEHLQWLHDTLLEAEKNGEKVHILLHIPNGGNYRFWSRDYARIIERFHHIITGQFCGHSHRNELHLFYDRENATYATNVLYNGGSLTTFSYVNPNYDVYYVDKTSFEVVDQDVYYVNLTNANLHPNRDPQWNYLYSFKDLWNVPDMSPKSMNALMERWTTDLDGLQRYWQLKGKDADPHRASGCSGKCLTNQICYIVTNEFGDDRRCKSLGV